MTTPANVIIFTFLMLAVTGGTPSLLHAQTTVVDRDKNHYPVKILLDNQHWITTNLNTAIPETYCYNDSIAYCKKYGRLYTWTAAQEGCRLLGEGWRLPTLDEWQTLARIYAGNASDSVQIRKRSFEPLLTNGTSGFDAVLGGGRRLDDTYARMEAHGFYWTATPSDSANAWFANFAKGSQALYLQPDGETPRGFSVRCVKSSNDK